MADAEVEIERKYLLSGMPELPAGAEWLEVAQGWLPGERIRERIRRVRTPGGEERWVRAIKLGAGVTRAEFEEPADPALGAALWALTAGRRVDKRRWRVPHDGLVWEIDEFHDRELVLAEIELPAEDHPVPIPSWLAPVLVREVTDEPAYLNIRLAR